MSRDDWEKIFMQRDWRLVTGLWMRNESGAYEIDDYGARLIGGLEWPHIVELDLS